MLVNIIRCNIQLDYVQRLVYHVRALEVVMAIPLSQSATRHLRYWPMTHMHVVRLCVMSLSNQHIRQQLRAGSAALLNGCGEGHCRPLVVS